MPLLRCLSVFSENMGHPQPIEIMIIKKCPKLPRIYGTQNTIDCHCLPMSVSPFAKIETYQLKNISKMIVYSFFDDL